MNAPLKSPRMAFAKTKFRIGVLWCFAMILFTIFCVGAAILCQSPWIFGALCFASIIMFIPGVSMACDGFIRISLAQKITPAQITLSVEFPRVGEEFIVWYSQTARIPISVLEHTLTVFFREIAIVTKHGEEESSGQQSVIHRSSFGPVLLECGEHLRRHWHIQIPRDAMHSFQGRKNQLQWVIQTKVTFMGLPAYEDDFIFPVSPEYVES